MKRFYGFAAFLAAAGMAAAQAPQESVLHILGTNTYVGSFAGATLPLGSGGGSVNSFSAGNLSPLFTTTVGTPTTTPALGFVLSNAGANLIFGNASGTSAPPGYSSLSAYMDSFFGTAQGTIVYRGASGWLPLAPGSSGQFLETLGASANVQWATASGSGNVSTDGSITVGQTAQWGTTTSLISVGNTGTGSYVLATSPTLVTPALGTPASGNLANCTFPNLTVNTSGTAANLSGMPALPNGTTATTQTAGDSSGKLANTAFVANQVVNVNSQSAAYTLALTDNNGCIYHPYTDGTARTYTIPANASVAFPVGAVCTVVDDAGAGTVTISINSDTLIQMGGTGSVSTVTVAASHTATFMKVASTRWIINVN